MTATQRLVVSRHRAVPPEFVGLRRTYGAILRERRRSGGYGKQAVVARDIGIAAATLSKIENGHVVPRLETLEALLERLELDWADVAV